MSHASLRMIVHVCNGIWRPLDSHASEEQRRRFVVPQVNGEIKVAFTLTEPTAGTGADIRSSVVREGDTYLLSGEKHLITFGTVADYLLLFARLEGTTGAEGTVALMVPPHGPGVTAARDARDDGRARHRPRPPDLRPRAGAGLEPLGRRGRRSLDRAVGVFGALADRGGMTCVGLASRALELALAYAKHARDLRQADRPAPGDRVQAGRDGHRPEGGARAGDGVGADCGRRPEARTPSRRWPSCSPRRCSSA